MRKFLLGLLAGVTVTGYVCMAIYKTELKDVGIDRIEHCHNTNSNWCEIVWADRTK